MHSHPQKTATARSVTLGGALVALLSACVAPQMSDAPALKPAFTDPSFAARVFGYREVSIVPQSGTGLEAKPLADTACTLGSAEITYPPFTAPVHIALPEVTGKPEPLILRCQNGDLRTAVRLDPVVDALGPAVPLPVGVALAGAKYAIAEKEDKWVHFARRGALTVTMAP